ncbi:MAG: hypothetical protein ACQEUI_06185 [Actinomycetota bacterium]
MGAPLQTTLDRAAVLPGIVGGERLRFFRDGIDGPSWAEQLALPTPILPDLHLGVPTTLTVETITGSLTVGLLLAHDAGARTPVLVAHHGNSERPFELDGRAKNFLNRALLRGGPPPDATVLLLRAAYHDGPLRDYTAAAGDIARWMSILAASVAATRAVVVRYGDALERPILLTGFSLGGWVANLHRAFDGRADRYVPMLAGAHLASQFLDSSYRHMTSRIARDAPQRLRALLDFDVPFRAASAEVAPLLAQHDRYARAAQQAEDYRGWPVTWLDTGHLGAALAGDQLRGHVLRQLASLAGPGRGS